MDHVWNSLKQWELIWKEQLQEELAREDHSYKQQNIKLLSGQLESIRKSMKEIGKWI